ncbi:MAG: PHP domain-containing protein [Armatimonadetes bacterium]|nr:PHP domain-containing protein [Armatimonadota bacterium]
MLYRRVILPASLLVLGLLAANHSLGQKVSQEPLNCDASGAIHVHSRFSDGSGTVEEIAQAANAAHLDFVVITDHNTLAGLKGGKEKRYGSVLVLVGEEVTPYENHYLALGIEKAVNPEGMTFCGMIRAVRDQGGFGIIAHPFDPGNGYFGAKPIPWTAWYCKGFDGMEIWSYCWDWGDDAHDKPSAVYFTLNPDAAIDGPRAQALKKWDELTAERPVVGIGSLDAHAVIYKGEALTLTVLPYRDVFETVRTHVLLPRPLAEKTAQDKRAIYDAIKKGHCYVSYDYLRNAGGFKFTGQTSSGLVNMGDSVTESTVSLSVETPAQGRIRLRRNGMLVLERHGRKLDFRATKRGAYRIEVALRAQDRFRPWIYSNPIYLR